MFKLPYRFSHGYKSVEESSVWKCSLPNFGSHLFLSIFIRQVPDSLSPLDSQNHFANTRLCSLPHSFSTWLCLTLPLFPAPVISPFFCKLQRWLMLLFWPWSIKSVRIGQDAVWSGRCAWIAARLIKVNNQWSTSNTCQHTRWWKPHMHTSSSWWGLSVFFFSRKSVG